MPVPKRTIPWKSPWKSNEGPVKAHFKHLSRKLDLDSRVETAFRAVRVRNGLRPQAATSLLAPPNAPRQIVEYS